MSVSQTSRVHTASVRGPVYHETSQPNSVKLVSQQGRDMPGARSRQYTSRAFRKPTVKLTTGVSSAYDTEVHLPSCAHMYQDAQCEHSQPCPFRSLKSRTFVAFALCEKYSRAHLQYSRKFVSCQPVGKNLPDSSTSSPRLHKTAAQEGELREKAPQEAEATHHALSGSRLIGPKHQECCMTRMLT